MLSAYIVAGILLAVLTVHGIYFVKKVHAVGWAHLSPSDHLAIASFYLNVVLLLVSVTALKIAVSAYTDAQKSGGEQLQELQSARQAIVDSGTEERNELDSARAALNSAVSIAAKQKTILERSLETSTRQLDIIRAERELALAQPDARAELVYPTDLAVIISNASKTKVATQIGYELVMRDFDHPFGEGFQLVSTKTASVDYVCPGSGYLPTKLDLLPSPASPPPKTGDRLFGYLLVQCPDCLRVRYYWFYWVYNEKGWFYEGNPSEYHILGLSP
jgi:hypothetical protein